MSINSRRGPGWKKKTDAIKERDGYVCVYQFAGLCTYDEDLTVDHIEPLDTFEQMYPGEDPDSDWNLATACRRCNSSKKNHRMDRRFWYDAEWFPNGMVR